MIQINGVTNFDYLKEQKLRQRLDLLKNVIKNDTEITGLAKNMRLTTGFLNLWNNTMKSQTMTIPEQALDDIEEMIEYSNVELADELLYTKRKFENKDSCVQLERRSKIDGITYFLNISDITSIVELSALLRRSNISTFVTQRAYRDGQFDTTVSYRKIGINQWGIIHLSATLDIPTN